MECLIGMAFEDFVMIAADQTNARYNISIMHYKLQSSLNQFYIPNSDQVYHGDEV